MTGRCTAKNSRTTSVRGCRGTSWKTWDRKTKYSHTNAVLIKTKCMVRQNTVARIESRKTAGSLPLIFLCNVFDFLFENLPLNKMYNVLSSCYCFNFDIDDLFCVKYQETRKVSLLRKAPVQCLARTLKSFNVFYIFPPVLILSILCVFSFSFKFLFLS